jgi:hypothetical protein
VSPGGPVARARDALRFLPTRRLAAAVAAVAPLWLLSGSETGAAGAALVTVGVAAAAVLDALALPAAGDLDVELWLPSQVGIGDRARGEYRVASRWPGRVRFRLHDALPAGVERVADALDAGDDASAVATRTVPSSPRAKSRRASGDSLVFVVPAHQITA